MKSHDLRGLIDFPRDAGRPAKKQKQNGTKNFMLKGIAREVQNLGCDSPIAIIPESLIYKKRRFGSHKPVSKWHLKPFKNTARDDQSLILRHWRRRVETTPKLDSEASTSFFESEIEDSVFAKFNVRVETVNYNDDQYRAHFQCSEWSKDETDYLMKLAEEFDLRWPIIWDRYDFQPKSSHMNSGGEKTVISTSKARGMEDLKERYYQVSSVILQLTRDKRHLTTHESSVLESMLKYNKQQEISRKKYAEVSFHRTIEEAMEEENLLLELKRILARSEKLGYERQELYALLDAPPTTNPIGAYTSSQGLQQLLASLVQADKAKRGKSLNAPVVSPAGPNQTNQTNQHIDSRREGNGRDPNSISIPANKKSGQGSSDYRLLTPEEEVVFGVRQFDRITATGPAFRHDKIMKLMISKSAIQQAKISNILSELRIPPRLLMPTYRVGEVFDSLQCEISVLLDLRKIADKLQGEISVLKSLKEEREKLTRTNSSVKDLEYTQDYENSIKEIAIARPKPKIEAQGNDEEESSDITLNFHKRSNSVASNQSIKRRKK
ncbi:SWR1-complex protein 4 [Golovinomyces cichoracearum]|uniref:SWR1-complex protein 4 n=1 Tax=Golovinomyces cichoracearum TaxID=62708 RepID=A0A420IW37_9PEZI|nr:SWR1-complex protein 4 [Golovinomyces cichoracearum]